MAFYHIIYIAINAKSTAMIIEGSIFATFIVFSQIKLMPTQNISIDPTKEILCNACSVIKGCIDFANIVINPCNNATGTAEKIQPFPINDASINIIMKSSIAFTASVE